MPNIKSAKKRMLVSQKKREQNLLVKAHMRNSIKKLKKAVENNAENREELLLKAFSSIDKAAGKNVIHKGNANRTKSRLQKLANK